MRAILIPDCSCGADCSSGEPEHHEDCPTALAFEVLRRVDEYDRLQAAWLAESKRAGELRIELFKLKRERRVMNYVFLAGMILVVVMAGWLVFRAISENRNIERVDAEAKRHIEAAVQKARESGTQQASQDEALRNVQEGVANASLTAERGKVRLDAQAEAERLGNDPEAQAEAVRKIIGSG